MKFYAYAALALIAIGVVCYASTGALVAVICVPMPSLARRS